MATTPVDLAAVLALEHAPAEFDTQLIDSALPLALFPVRIETRFATTATGGSELWVRVYPDKVHIDSHEPRLTSDELMWGKQFRTATWQAGSDEAARRTAWRQLATRFGAPRAAWVARALTPTNSQDHATAPEFPDVGDPVTTMRTPVARLLPTRWIATAYAGGAIAAVARGNEIPAGLAVGPDVRKALAPESIPDDELAVDDGMKWMIDFGIAQQVGMGLRIPLPGPVVDLLVVTGVRAGDASAELAAQFDAHHYSDGLAFVAAGTPTNNTDAARSGVGALDSEQRQSFDSEWVQRPGAGSAARLAADAFGVSSFEHIGAADDQEEVVARAMMTALWPATWGYYLAQMVGFDGPFTPIARDAVRAHALSYLRPGGPLPAVRCGTQPYGVLPVTALDRWSASPASTDAGYANGIRVLLTSLRDAFWRPAIGTVARVGSTDDADADLIAVLQGAAMTSSWGVRRMMGQHFLQHLRAFLGESLDAVAFWQQLVELGSAAAQQAQLGFTPAIAHAAFESSPAGLQVPLVGSADYLDDVAAAATATLAGSADAMLADTPPGAPLLHVLLRHAFLRQLAEDVARKLDTPDTPFAQLVRDAELNDLLPAPTPTRTWSWQRAQQIDGQTVLDDAAAHPGAELADFLAAVGALAGKDPAGLERHLVSTLDSASHRLDAWTTSLATRRLAELRASSATGLSVGGYAWVENLRPAADRAPAPQTPDEPAPLFVDADDPGFIHAPSLNHAGAAALLRNAHLAHGAAADSAYAVELTSARARAAMHLIDGVRQGQPLGALLGYRFERSLHDAGLDVFIDDFRSMCPLPGADGVRVVVDGLALSQRWQSDGAGVLTALASSGLTATDPRRADLTSTLDSLAAAVDATADAITAESAFQMMRGNVSRAAATVDSVSSGQTPPPDLGFLRTPRTGVAIAHRVATLWQAVDDRNASDSWAISTPRANADPALAAWAANLLGPVSTASIAVSELASDGSVTAVHSIAVASLGMAAIDLVWATGGVEGDPPELVSRVLDLAATASDGPRPGADLRVDTSALAPQLELAVRLHRLLAGARPADGADLQPQHADPQRGLDVPEYLARADAAEQALTAARAALTQADEATLRTAALTAAAFGVPSAVPVPGTPLTVQVSALGKDIDSRMTKLARLPADDATLSDEVRRDRALERFRAIFGANFLALPQFTCAQAADVAASVADAAALLGDDALAAHTWLTQMERVREPLARLTRVAREAEVMHGADRLAPAVAQLPHVAGQRWVGAASADGTSTAQDGCVSLVLVGSPQAFTGPFAGIVIDEWTEVVPNRSETSAIAFRYDPPDLAAPQAILLAVPPVLGEPWSVRSLNHVLIETLEAARLRAVDPTALGAAAHYLPATQLAFNVAGDAVSTDLHSSV
jgi:hypothetical protein